MVDTVRISRIVAETVYVGSPDSAIRVSKSVAEVIHSEAESSGPVLPAGRRLMMSITTT